MLSKPRFRPELRNLSRRQQNFQQLFWVGASWHPNMEGAMDRYLPSFRLEFPDTYNEYRIVDGHVQFRPEAGDWRTMDADDIRMHFALRTPVASWIRSNTSQNLALAM
jgi:hypothetical protein